MALSTVIIRGGAIVTMDENSKKIGQMPNTYDLAAIGTDFFVCTRGIVLTTFDEHCNKIAGLKLGDYVVRSAAGNTFTCQRKNHIVVYDKYCNKISAKHI